MCAFMYSESVLTSRKTYCLSLSNFWASMGVIESTPDDRKNCNSCITRNKAAGMMIYFTEKFKNNSIDGKANQSHQNSYPIHFNLNELIYFLL